MNNQLAESVNPAEVMKNRITEGVAMHRKSAAVLMFEILDLVARSRVYRNEGQAALEGAAAMLPALELEVKPNGGNVEPRVYSGAGKGNDAA